MRDHDPTGDLVLALAALTDPPRDGKVEAGQRRYRYLELPDLLAEVRGKFGAHGWAILQQITTEPGAITVINLWIHHSGVKITHPGFTMPSGRTPQEIGSAITYARRYSLAALTGLSGSNDDDAETLQAIRERPQPRTRVTVAKAADPEPEARGIGLGEPEPAAPPTLPNRTISPPQMRMMSALIREWEQRNQQTLDQDGRRALIAQLAGINPDQLESAKNLTAAQASRVIDALNTQATDG